ncbi:MAG: molybdopterin-dependent oxidoreductase [Dehalococcoidia bacterium]|nr:molybdopterin-dependent oxidoreductase [Dehalococcoidia bacterium]
MAEFSVIGKRVPKIDSTVKATGEAQYTADMVMPGMLWGKVLHSPVPHARILNIDYSRALRLPGVRGVVTGKDAKGEKYGFIPYTRDKMPFETEKVRYIGDEIAAVAAIDEDIAEEALSLIKVDLEELPAVFDPVKALKEGAPQIHDHVKNNLSAETHIRFGNVEEGFKDSYLIREATFDTQYIMHGFIEPPAALGIWDHTGKATLWAAKQSPYIAYRHIARGLGIPLSKLRLIQPFVGAGFGGKHEPFGLDFACLLLSQKTGRPVKIAYTQEEVFLVGRRRHAEVLTPKIGMKKDGTISVVQWHMIADGGAYSSVGALSIYIPGATMTFPLRVPHVKYDAYRAYTNKPFAGALIGHGMPQARFALDSLLDDMAEELGIDPLELRFRNAVKPGETTVNKFKITTFGFEDTLKAVAGSIRWTDKRGKRQWVDGKVRGVGLGVSPGVVGNKLGGHDGSAAIVKMNEDGTVTLIGGFTDIGQGAETVMAMMVAEDLGLTMDEINVTKVDSEMTPMDPGTFGSRTTFCSGRAVRAASADVRRQLFEHAAEKLEANPADLDMRDRKVFVKGSPDRNMPLLQVIRELQYGKGNPVIGRGTASPDTDFVDFRVGIGNMSAAYSAGTQGAEVEIDVETGQIHVVKMANAHDCGRALHPGMVEGQQQGTATSGLGQVLFEDTIVETERGEVVTTNFADYKMPTVFDTFDKIDCFHIETNDPKGPFGAKDAGEAAQIAALPAIANAVADALGIRMKSLPILPEKVLKALDEKNMAIQSKQV